MSSYIWNLILESHKIDQQMWPSAVMRHLKNNEIEFIEMKNTVIEMRSSIDGLDIRRED